MPEFHCWHIADIRVVLIMRCMCTSVIEPLRWQWCGSSGWYAIFGFELVSATFVEKVWFALK